MQERGRGGEMEWKGGREMERRGGRWRGEMEGEGDGGGGEMEGGGEWKGRGNGKANSVCKSWKGSTYYLSKKSPPTLLSPPPALLFPPGVPMRAVLVPSSLRVMPEGI